MSGLSHIPPRRRLDALTGCADADPLAERKRDDLDGLRKDSACFVLMASGRGTLERRCSRAIDRINAMRSAKSCTESPFSRPSGIRETPVEAIASICSLGITSVAPSDRLTTIKPADSLVMIPEMTRPSAVATL